MAANHCPLHLEYDVHVGQSHLATEGQCVTTTLRETLLRGNPKKKGKAKMKQFGSANIPQKAFVSVLRADKD